MNLLRRLSFGIELDLRSLAVFRIVMGLCLCSDLATKLFYAKDFYSDWGLMPRTYWVSNYMNDHKISLMLANGEAWFQYAFLLVALICAVLFTVGYKTRFFQIITLVLLGSIQSRNYLLLSAADDLLRLSLFWSLLLPLDRYYSITNPALTSSSQTETGYRSFAGGLFILQLVIMYLFTAFYKVNPTWTTDSSAIYYALNIDHFATPVGKWLSQFTSFGIFLTRTTLIWEFVGPLLLFIPFKAKVFRSIAALGFIFFHLGLAVCLNLGTFPWVAIAYWCALLPGEVWDVAFQKVRKTLPTVPKVSASSEFLNGKKLRLMESIFSGCMVLVLLQNISDVTQNKVFLPGSVKTFLLTTNLNQVWDMFAPYPIRNDGWFVLEGTFKNGETRDLLTNKNVTFEKPNSVADLYSTSEWRKFYLFLWDQGERKILLPFARYMCRSSKSTQEESPLSTLKITFMKETTPPLGMEFPEVVPITLWQHDCFAQ
ncbi:HTTM domain-containing protein [Bdellovibrio sp. HCB-162]|uniref:HTTM domain-containing protein n=1 Tax=Bdellovibrio sp. HCB-162 TaxID=3394234 RepID=UPI0039BD18C8